MKITLDLPEFDNPGHMERAGGDDYDHNPGACPICGNELYGLTARLHPLGYVHAVLDDDETGPTCLEKAVQERTADPATAWLTVAQHIAKYPSRHGVATIRAVITNLIAIIRGGAAR